MPKVTSVPKAPLLPKELFHAEGDYPAEIPNQAESAYPAESSSLQKWTEGAPAHAERSNEADSFILAD